MGQQQQQQQKKNSNPSSDPFGFASIPTKSSEKSQQQSPVTTPKSHQQIPQNFDSSFFDSLSQSNSGNTG